RLLPALALGAIFVASPIQANTGSRMLQERFKTVLNELVLKVKSADDPADKRAIMLRFVTHMEEGLEKAQTMTALTERDRRSLNALQAAFHDYAGYMQQQMEQAPVGGGIYISAGALLVIILILLILL